jgi:hypothetical protein
VTGDNVVAQMMNKRDRGRPPKPVIFGPPVWIPLEAAFFRIRDCLGSRALAARDLHRDLLNGRLKGARRGFDSNGAEIEAVECDSDYWQGINFKERRWPLHHDGSDPGLHCWLPAEKYAVTTPNLYEMFVFVRRAELDQLYPEAKSEQAPVAVPLSNSDSKVEDISLDKWRLIDEPPPLTQRQARKAYQFLRSCRAENPEIFSETIENIQGFALKKGYNFSTSTINRVLVRA